VINHQNVVLFSFLFGVIETRKSAPSKLYLPLLLYGYDVLLYGSLCICIFMSQQLLCWV